MTQASIFDAPVSAPVAPQGKTIHPDSRLARVAGLFVRRRGEWIDSEELAAIGGRCAWRTRVSECRTLLGMRIDNRQRKEPRYFGVRFDDAYVVSEYRYVVPSGERQA